MAKTSERGWLHTSLVLVMAVALLSGCASNPGRVVEPGGGTTEFVFGIHTTDWALRGPAEACAAGCGGVSDIEERYLCMAKCPGFVSERGGSCEAESEWVHCEAAAMGTSANAKPRVDAGQVVGTAFAIVGVVALAATCLYLSEGRTACIEHLD